MTAFQALAANAALGRGKSSQRFLGYGSLASVKDANTGLPLLRLPEGFWYTSFGWTGDIMLGGLPTPEKHDGMGIVGQVGDFLLLVRNHEINGLGVPFGDPAITYDTTAAAGTVTLLFDPTTGQHLSSSPSLAGTSSNCGGGPTPWGSWLSCEETNDGVAEGHDEEHGWVFEVPGVEVAQPVPLTDMGRFLHEAIAVDPVTGLIYQTEDRRYVCGFYRFTPTAPNALYSLQQGGVLEMLKVVGVDNADLQQVRKGDEFDVEWRAISQPTAPKQTGVGPFGSFDGQTTNTSGPFLQGMERGCARFRKLEGSWFGDGGVYFVDSEGGHPAKDTGKPEGTVWFFDPVQQRLRVIFESPAASVLDNPDNVTLSPRGGLVLCEDGTRDRSRMHGITPKGQLFLFAENNVVLAGEKNGITGDYRDDEWAGACFDPTGKWLFVNLFKPGISFAITGPWGTGLL